ncbi:2OG-Fe(II) oxygenase [Candidatus Nitrospira bockiana]
MRIKWSEFEPNAFSFLDDPVLILEDFWTASERALFREAMSTGSWTSLSDMPAVRADFPGSGNWSKGELGARERGVLLSRLQLPCIAEYVESFPAIASRHVSFHYYSYGPGDCLLTHDDTVQRGGQDPVRRVAVVTYLHDEWAPDWGGELILYQPGESRRDRRPALSITHCIAPDPGALVLFTVPRLHRVCRVDPTCGEHRRLSIAGWFMTSHAVAAPRRTAAPGQPVRR